MLDRLLRRANQPPLPTSGATVQRQAIVKRSAIGESGAWVGIAFAPGTPGARAA